MNRDKNILNSSSKDLIDLREYESQKQPQTNNPFEIAKKIKQKQEEARIEGKKDKIGPNSYNPNLSAVKKQKNSTNFGLSKSQRSTTYAKNAGNMPGPGQYTSNTKTLEYQAAQAAYQGLNLNQTSSSQNKDRTHFQKIYKKLQSEEADKILDFTKTQHMKKKQEE